MLKLSGGPRPPFSHPKMIIQVKVKPNSKFEKVEEPKTKLWEDRSDFYIVHVKEPPIEGRANDAVLNLLADHFGVARSKIVLKRGANSKIKYFEI